MVTLNSFGINGTTYYGLHDDSKPSGVSVPNGACFVEMDAGKIYFYDAANDTWLEWGASE